MEDQKYLPVSTGEKVKESAEVSAQYIELVRRVSGRSFEIQKMGTGGLIGSAEGGMIEATRRISGTNVALIESNYNKSPVKNGDVKLNVEGENGEKRDFGLGDKEWHLLTQDELFADLETRITGLTSEEAKLKLERYGPNRITPPKVTHWFVKFLWTLVGGFQVCFNFPCFFSFFLIN